MSDEERDLARIRAWDRLQRARITYGAQRQVLSDCVKKFSGVAQSLQGEMDNLTGDELATMPTLIQYKKAVIDYRAAADDLKVAEGVARELGWGEQIR